MERRLASAQTSWIRIRFGRGGVFVVAGREPAQGTASAAHARRTKYKRVKRYMRATAELTPEDRAHAVRKACDLAVKEGQVAAGISSVADAGCNCEFARIVCSAPPDARRVSITMQQDPAASWAKGNAADVRELDPLALAKRASAKAKLAASAVELAPQKYTVILEPAAVLDLVGFLFYDFARQRLEDKRSCLNDRMGKPLFGKNISLMDDVYHPGQLGAPFDGEGVPRQRVVLADNGVRETWSMDEPPLGRAGKKPTGHGFTLPNEYARRR